ncbi:uncharacterized protein TNCV_2844251 [Trichonephila clavipes]|nr:uncharacterized protein TNCV_2844251 [Trichonephila clavipes]
MSVETLGLCVPLENANSIRRGRWTGAVQKIEIEFYVDLDDRHMNVSMDTVVRPKFNYPSFVVIQLGLHNNYASLSPYKNGIELLGGKQYEITLKQLCRDARFYLHPARTAFFHKTYNTNDKPFEEMAMEECKYNLSLEEFGCIPYTVDYPHNDSICKMCEACFNMTYVESRCEKLLEKYNQPCDYISYQLKTKEKYKLIRKNEGLGSKPGECMDVCKRIGLLQHEVALNSHRAVGPVVRLVEEEERLEAPEVLEEWSASKLGLNEDKS